MGNRIHAQITTINIYVTVSEPHNSNSHRSVTVNELHNHTDSITVNELHLQITPSSPSLALALAQTYGTNYTPGHTITVAKHTPQLV